MGNFHIEEAFCLELARNITIFEANDYYFSQQTGQRNRLHFECPDEKCRNELHPTIIGVNYDKEIFLMPMHFRRNFNNQHRADCFLGRYEKYLKEMIGNKNLYRTKSDRNLFLELPYSDKIPDIFQPRRIIEATRKSRKDNINIIHTTRQDGDNIESKILRERYRTRSLKSVVDAFEKLEPEQRNMPSLSIDGITLKYGIIFKHIRAMESWHTWPHIYYGAARIFRYKDGYRAFFNERVRRYAQDKPNLEASIFFPAKAGEIIHEHPYDALERAARSKEHCCIYMFASKNLVNAPLGSSGDSKEWIRLDTEPGETVITFNERLCI